MALADEFLRALRYSSRQLRRNPVFTVIAVATLALGIGANTAVFSIVENALLRPLPYPHSERLMFAQWGGSKEWLPNVTAADVLFWKSHSQAFEDIGAYGPSSGANLAAGQEVRHVNVSGVSEGFFRTLGVKLMRGRDFSPDEARPGELRAAIVSYSLWENILQSQFVTLGESIHLNGQTYKLAGVLPRDFEFVAAADVYVPLQLAMDPNDRQQNYSMIARLKPGVTPEQLQDDSLRVLQAFQQEYPNNSRKDWPGIRWMAYGDQLHGSVKRPLLILFGSVSLVLLIAIVNMANLFVAQASARRADIGIRIALGASRTLLLVQLVTESLVITSLGGLVGLMVAPTCLQYLLAIIPKTNSIDFNTSLLPLSESVALNGNVFGYSILVILVAGAVIGVLAWARLTRLSSNDWIRSKSTTESVTQSKLRNLLVVSEIALSMTLLFSTALLLASFYALRSVKLGFDPNNVWALQVSLPPDQYKTTADAWTFQNTVSERLKILPGVLGVATTSNLPVERALNFPYEIAGCGHIEDMQIRAISSDYFRVMAIPVLRGRVFLDRDNQTPFAMINNTLARRCWPQGDPVGKIIGKTQIIGVVEDTREQGLDRSDLPVLYLPQWQVPDFFTKMVHNWFLAAWVIKTRTEPDAKTIQSVIASVDPSEPIADLRPMVQVVSGSSAMANNAFMRTLLTAFAALALLLAAIGVFGIALDVVVQRTQEIGVRMALGAQEYQILGSVVWHALRLGIAGAALGLACSLGIGYYLRSLLFGVQLTNPFIIISVPLGLILLTVAASYVPARWAARVDPIVALRSE